MSIYSDNVLVRSPAGYWRVGETVGTTGANSVIDASGNAKHLTTSGSPTFGGAGAIAYDSDTSVAMASSAYCHRTDSVIANTPSAFTLMTWVNGAPAAEVCFMAVGSSSNTLPVLGLFSGQALHSATSRLRGFVRDDAGTFHVGGSSSHQVGTVLDGSWHHAAMTFGSDTARLYVDGVLLETIGSITLGTTTLNRTAIGALVRGSAGSYFTGSIDEPAAFATQLSDADIAEIYRIGRGTTNFAKVAGFMGGL